MGGGGGGQAGWNWEKIRQEMGFSKLWAPEEIEKNLQHDFIIEEGTTTERGRKWEVQTPMPLLTVKDSTCNVT